MTVQHIFKEHFKHPQTSNVTAQRMMCGVTLPTSWGDTYITKATLMHFARNETDPKWNKCEECFNHPEIQLLLLANTDLGDE